MFFEKETLSFYILDVFELKQSDVDTYNKGRNFNALSFRTRSNAVLSTANQKYQMSDNFVSYFPARLDYSRRADIDELIVVHFDTVNYHSNIIECFEPKHPDRIAKLFSRMLELWNKKELGYKYKCSAVLCEIFAECYIQNHSSVTQSSKIQASVDHLLKNYKSSDLSIKDIADRSFMSEVYFRRLFKKEYGISPQRYIINLRLQYAAGLISSGYYSLKEVAYMSGYSDYKYFSVEFKRIMKISPSEYQNNYK